MSSPPVHALDHAPSRAARVWSAAQFLVALAVTGGFLAYLLLSPSLGAPGEEGEPERPAEAVTVSGRDLVLDPDTKLAKGLQVVTVRSDTLRAPLFSVTGTVAASRRPGREKGKDFWQFNSPEALTTHADWEKAAAEIEFAEAQLKSIRELADQRVKSQTEVVARLRRLVDAGTDSVKDLRTEENNLSQYRITGRKEVHEADTAVRVARRNEAALARQIQQAGLDPELLRTATPDLDIVVADVPEGRIADVKKGQGCRATFFGLPDVSFVGTVTSLAPVLSRERRTLRVLFTILDPDDLLRPGMFAEIGLGTDPRSVIRVPAEGVVHVGRADYVLVGREAGTWRPTEVKVGEGDNGDVEILSGLAPGERVLGKGAILLKPFVARATRGDGK